jgi:hypothetical protein
MRIRGEVGSCPVMFVNNPAPVVINLEEQDFEEDLFALVSGLREGVSVPSFARYVYRSVRSLQHTARASLLRISEMMEIARLRRTRRIHQDPEELGCAGRKSRRRDRRPQ